MSEIFVAKLVFECYGLFKVIGEQNLATLSNAPKYFSLITLSTPQPSHNLDNFTDS